MRQLLFQPYPLTFNKKQKILIAILAGIFVTFFLGIFQPFGLHSWPGSFKWIVLAGYGMITTLSMVIWELAHIYFFHRKGEEKWRVWMEMLSILLLVTAIGFGNWLYGTFLGFSALNSSSLWNYMRMTYLIGIFPSVLIPLINYIQKLKRHTQKSNQLNQQLKAPKAAKEKSDGPDIIILEAENEKDTFSCLPENLYSISTADNYATICFLNPASQKLQKQLIRSSLNRLEGQLKQEQIQRCHRSFIVNLALIESVSGNSQGYQLLFPHDHPPIPLSRKYAPKVLKWLEESFVIPPKA